MNILLFGRGVITTLYGWTFEKAGHNVTFYVRPGRSAEYGSHVHLDIFDMRRGAQRKHVDEDWPIRMVEELPADHSYDLILVSVQEWMFAEVAKLLESRAGHATILIFSNFWRDPEEATRGLPKDQVAWGFPLAGGAFHANVLRGAIFASVNFGTFSASLTRSEVVARKLFRDCGFKIAEKTNFRDWLWIHFATNAGLMSQAIYADSMESVMGSFSQAREAALTLREMLPVLRARGINLRQNFMELTPLRMPPYLFAAGMVAAFSFSKPFQAVVGRGDHKEETSRTVISVLQQAAELGIETPRLRRAANRLGSLGA
ncbi:ketopantoate reductase family protein [Granulicella sp. S156]|uniref:ketopantoate reductase family protein n=1 Tax=Granulicella sp. S156 TaxID=1747224 RepID=UPI00131B8CA9|nr:2-dehydropantoate 2-reductase N-terminal domain-containing protein [Granulicella sp. S156]